MTLRMERVAAQLPAVVERYRDQLAAMEAGLAAAGTTLDRWSEDPQAGDEAVARAMEGTARPYALAFGDESPGAVHDAAPAAPVTVVASDGSSIEPDRFAAVQCFVINIGVAILPYGVTGQPELSSTPRLGPEAPPHGDHNDGGEAIPGGQWAVSLRRDVAELEAGAEAAVARLANGRVVLLVDGTLFPWDLDSPRVDLELREALRRRTQMALDRVADAGQGISMGAYISGSRAGDVVNSLSALAAGPRPPWPGSDGQFFARRLAEGQRSAVFRARSQRPGRAEEAFEPGHEALFFYLRVGGDVARVELPHGMATPEQVRRLQATLVDQCRRCGGYPRALQEAHEQAVVSGADRLQFERLLEAESARAGLYAMVNGKQMSKRRRAV